jgi:ParB family chromosome partitioning protein
MAKPKGLGRGLGALIPDNAADAAEGESLVIELDVNSIAPNQSQPRKTFDAEKLKELAESIKAHGVIQPIMVTKEGNGYRLVAGERRYRAALLAGLDAIPAIVREVSEREIAEIALIENIQRESLTDIEEAMAFVDLRDAHHASQEEIAALVGRSRASVANTIRLLQLPQEVQDLLSSGLLTAGHCRAVLSLEDAGKRAAFARALADSGSSVREAEKLSKTFGKETAKAAKPSLHPSMLSFEEDLSSRYGTKVKIKASPKGKGKIEIEYYSGEDLERILSILGGEGHGL